MNRREFLQMMGVHPNPVRPGDNLISALGGFLGIFGIFVTSYWLLDAQTAVLIVPSMGATAVLLFAAPHVPFSQPWNVLGGHAVSALVGVACWQWIPDPTLAASASVGIAIGLMYALRCIHPPGGATALAAVIGSEKLHRLGFAYEFEPVLLNTVTILLVAVAFNALFHWRRYPAWLNRKPVTTKGYAPIPHEDFVYALAHLDTLVDVSEEDLIRIYELATRRKVERERQPSD